jgi:very-short-patch-repair endonuclease
MKRNEKPPPTTHELFRTQYGLASDAQLLTAKVTAGHLQRRLREEDWVRVCPGVIRLNGTPDSWHQTPMAVTLSPRRSVVGLGSALRVHGLDGFRTHEQVDAFLERHARREMPSGVKVHSSRRLVDTEITTVDGIRVTSIPTSLLQSMSEYDSDLIEKALDDALRGGARPAWFTTTIERWAGRGVTGPNELRAMLADRVGGRIPRSWFQRLADRALRELGVELEAEVPVHVGRRHLADLDLANRELLVGVECQSWEHHSSPAAIRADLERKRRLRKLGWEIVELWWSDLNHMDRVVADLQISIERQRVVLGIAI